MENNDVHPEVKSVTELMEIGNLSIPDYQRPYKWTERNVNQFIFDLIEHSKKENYRIGNIILHSNNDKLDIVDGQQRFITLLLIFNAINAYKNQSLGGTWEQIKKYLNCKKLKCENPITQYNLYHNYQVIKQHSLQLYQIRKFIINKVEIVKFVLENQSEAFQFFDSQNARGKELYPHDLLKAFHLREFPESEKRLKKDVVETWEGMESEELSELFELYLYRIKAWSKGQKAWYFTKNEIGWFKGININKTEDYPYVNSYRLIHNRIDDKDEDIPNYFDNRRYLFPFQLDKVIINGRRFFEMITVYKELIDTLEEILFTGVEQDETAQEIMKTIESYDGYNRTGDKYVRNLFKASLFYYIDKFGIHGISEAIRSLFVWSYRLRLEKHSVRVETIINHAQEGFSDDININGFRVIADSIKHDEIRKLVNKPIKIHHQRKIPKLVNIMNQLNVTIEESNN